MTDRIARLLAKAKSHTASKTFRYPVCLDIDIRDQLTQTRQMIETAASAAALAEKYPAKDNGDAPTRRTIGDRVNSAQQAVEDLHVRAQELLDTADARDSLVVVEFGIPAAAREHAEGVTGWYREWKEATTAGLDASGGEGNPTRVRRVLTELPAVCFVAIKSTDGEDIGMSWAEARQELLDDADVEVIEGGVLALVRGTSGVPFDPANFGPHSMT